MAEKKTQAKKVRRQESKRKSLFRDFLEVVIPAFLIFLVVRTFFFEARWVPSPSMVPTLQERDFFLENKLVYRFRAPRRGEIVVFHPPQRALPPGTTRSEDFVKRIIGLPGETVRISDGKVYIKPKEGPEFLLAEPYIDPDRRDYGDFGPFIVGRDEYFVLGDNRRQSRDSRYWGCVPRRNISGKAFWRFWPPWRISLLR
ncbi:MAG: signal peptidase I [Bacillota bacterium]